MPSNSGFANIHIFLQVDHFQVIQKDPVLKKKLEHAAYTQNCNFFEEVDRSHLETSVSGEALRNIIQRRRETRFAYVRLGSRKLRKSAPDDADTSGNDDIELETRKRAHEDPEARR